MAWPVVAAMAAPAVGNFLGGAFGGRNRGEPPEAIFQRMLQTNLKQLPQFDASGMLAAQQFDINRQTGLGAAQMRERFRQILGPRARSATEASIPGSVASDRARLYNQARIGVNQLAFQNALQRFSTAAGPAAGVTGLQYDYSQSRPPVERAFGLGMATLGQNLGDYYNQQNFLNMMGKRFN